MNRLLLILLTLPLVLQGSPFRAVFVTDDDVAKLGGYPIPRRHYAEALHAAKQAGAQAVILKFFMDLPGKVVADDAALAEAIKNCGLPVVLQARIDDSEKSSNPLPERFLRKDLPIPPGAINGNNGWLPLPTLADGAYSVAFIDSLNPVPMVEVYRGHPMPSLFLVTLELALGKASWTPGSITLNGTTLPMHDGQIAVPFPSRDEFKSLSLSALLDGRGDNDLKGAIVIIGYDGREMHTFPTPIGPIKANRLFFYELELAYAAFSTRN
jgi:CHASE2 domain-containing sensor protein